MVVYISRDYAPITTGYPSNVFNGGFFYLVPLFLRRVLGFSYVGSTAFNLDDAVQTLTVTGASNTTPIQITTSTPHGFSNDDSHGVLISGVGGNTNANGSWVIGVTGANTFTLRGSSPNGAFTSGGTVSSGFLYASGLVSDGYGAGINFGTGLEREVSIPISKRTVSAGDIGRVLVLKSNRFPTKNAGLFKISAINAGANRYIIDYRATENPPVEPANSMDWWLYEVENTASGKLTTQTYNNTLSVNAATNASPIAITTSSNHNFTTGNLVTIVGALGNTAANGTWTITVTGGATFTLNGSTGNGTYTSGAVSYLENYSGDGLAYTSRIVLQSPHSTGWQVRVATEPRSASLPLVSITAGYGGNSQGDFPVGGAQTHLAQFFDANIIRTGLYGNLHPGGGALSGAVTRLTMVGDGYGQCVFMHARTAVDGSGIFMFGIPNNETVTSPNSDRIFSYGPTDNAVSGTYNFGTIALRVGTTGNVGICFRRGIPRFLALTSWANLDGTSATSPMFSANAGDSPFSSSTEVLPIELWAATTADLVLSQGVQPPFFFDQEFVGLAPFLRVGRSNFGNFTLTTEDVTTRSITAATNATPIQITTSTTNTYVSGQTVTISGVAGNTAANGTWIVTVINGTNFTLNDSAGNGTYTSGGTVNGSARFVHLQNGIYLQWDGASGLTP